MATPVSIVIPTLNGAATLPEVFAAIASQRYAGAIEILAIDSGSTDGTPELLARHAARLITIDRSEFNHGLSRNVAIAASAHPYVVLLVQDAVPAGPAWLESLVAPLDRDPSIAATWARQVPRPGADPLTRLAMSRWSGHAATARVVSLSNGAEFASLSPWDRMQRCTLDNVCACVRRSVWQQHPFGRVPIAEDIEWARDVLLAGYRIQFVPEAVVVHSHERSPRYEFSRTVLVHHRLRTLFGLSTIPGLIPLVRAVAATLGSHVACVRADPSARWRLATWWRALTLAVAWPLGQYVGARLAARGIDPPRFGGFGAR